MPDDGQVIEKAGLVAAQRATIYAEECVFDTQ